LRVTPTCNRSDCLLPFPSPGQFSTPLQALPANSSLSSPPTVFYHPFQHCSTLLRSSSASRRLRQVRDLTGTQTLFRSAPGRPNSLVVSPVGFQGRQPIGGPSPPAAFDSARLKHADCPGFLPPLRCAPPALGRPVVEVKDNPQRSHCTDWVLTITQGPMNLPPNLYGAIIPLNGTGRDYPQPPQKSVGGRSCRVFCHSLSECQNSWAHGLSNPPILEQTLDE